MKTKLLSLTIISMLFLTACSFNAEDNSSSGGDDNNGDGFNIDNGGGGTDTGGSGGTGGSGSTCAGNTSDGTGSGTPIHHFDLFLAGHQTWMPGTYTNPLASSTMPTTQEASIVFRSDSRLKVRLKINSQPYPTAGQEYCYGRAVGQAGDAFNYTKLRFRIHLRDVMCDNIDPSNSYNCLSGFYLGSPYQYKYISPVDVSSCSEVIDVGAMRNQTQFGTAVIVEDVKSDSTCQANDTYCPAEKIVRAASCWHMTMQIVTDYTQDFK